MNYPETKISRSKAALSTVVKSLLAIGLIFWLIKSGSIRLEYLSVPFSKVPTLLAGSIVTLIAMALSALRYKELLQGAGSPLGLFKCIKITSIMYFFSQCVLGPASGDFARYFYTVKETEKGAHAGAAILADRIIGTMGLIGLCGLGMVLNWSLVKSSPNLRTVAVPVLGLVCGLWLSLFLGVVSLIKGRITALLIGMPIYLYSFYLCSGAQTSFLAEQIGPVLFAAATCAVLSALIAPEFLEDGIIFKKLFSNTKTGSRIGELISALLVFRNCPLLLLKIILITATQHMLYVLALFIFSQTQNLPAIPDFSEVFFAAPFSFLAGIIPSPAAGLGINEAAFETLLSLV
ncbi:MAG: hypothetical protein BA863_18965, partial [Desulfovibrio sp. S3730MH75]